MVSAVHEQHAIAFRGKPKLRWRRCQQRAKIQTALVHLRLWKHIFCEVHPVGTVVGQAPHNSKPVLKFYQVPPAICFRCVVTPSWYLTNLSDDPEWLDYHKAKRPHPPSNGPPTKRPGFWVTVETLGKRSFGGSDVGNEVLKCKTGRFHGFPQLWFWESPCQKALGSST